MAALDLISPESSHGRSWSSRTRTARSTARGSPARARRPERGDDYGRRGQGGAVGAQRTTAGAGVAHRTTGGRQVRRAQIIEAVHGLGYHTYLLDGDDVRQGLNRDLGFTDADRVENIRRVAEIAKLMVDAGLIVLAAFISPFAAERGTVRSLVKDGEFIEIHVDTPLAVAEERDTKGLYKKARQWRPDELTGIDSPYEPPEAPEVYLDMTALTPEDAAAQVIDAMRRAGVLELESGREQ